MPSTIVKAFRLVTPSGPGNPCVNDVAADDGCLVVAADDGRVRVLNLGGGTPALDDTVTPGGPRILANSIDVAGDTVVVGNHHGQVMRLRRCSTGVERVSLAELDAGPINTVSIGPDGSAVVGCYAGAVSIVTPSGDVAAHAPLGRGAIKSLATADAETVVVGTAGGDIGRVDLSSGRAVWLPGHDAIVNAVALGPDLRSLVSVGRDFTVRWTDIWSGEVTACAALEERSPKAVLHASQGIAHVGDYWGWVTVVHASGRVLASRSVSTSGVSCLAYTGAGIVAGSYDGSVTVLDPTTLDVLGRISLTAAVVGGGAA